MTQVIDLGKLRFYWAGAYNAATQYELNDVVRYGGNVYVYINVVKTIGNDPSNTFYWAVMVEGINFVGAWNPATQYFVGDSVAYGSTVYVALTNNINKQPDLFPADWSQFLEGIQYEGIYDPATTYQPNDVVNYGPSAYIAIQTTNNNPPTDATYWSSFVQGISPEGVYNNAATYVPGDVVAYGANLYVCIDTTVGNLPTDPTYWTLFVDTIRTRGNWVTATLYYVNDIVTHGGNTYICLIENVSSVFNTDLAANKWQVFNGGVRWRGTFAPATQYLTNDIVYDGSGSTYIATTDFISAALMATDIAAGRFTLFAQGANVTGIPPVSLATKDYILSNDGVSQLLWTPSYTFRNYVDLTM